MGAFGGLGGSGGGSFGGWGVRGAPGQGVWGQQSERTDRRTLTLLWLGAGRCSVPVRCRPGGFVLNGPRLTAPQDPHAGRRKQPARRAARTGVVSPPLAAEEPLLGGDAAREEGDEGKRGPG